MKKTQSVKERKNEIFADPRNGWDGCVDPDEWMTISKKKKTRVGWSIRQIVCMCEFTRRVFEDVVFGMYIILYIRTNHWLYNTTQIYLYFMLKQLRYYLFLRSSYRFSLLIKFAYAKYIYGVIRRRNFSLSLVAKRRGRRKTEACVVSYRKTVEGNRKKERGGGEPRVTVIFREELNRQILLTNGNMTRAYRQGEPVHWRLVVRSLMITGDLLIFVVIFSPSSSVFLILDGLRNAHALVK